MNYQLTAELYGAGTSVYSFVAPSDDDAVFYGSFTVMELASNSVIWARGYIRLVNKDTGDVIKTMDAKPVNA